MTDVLHGSVAGRDLLLVWTTATRSWMRVTNPAAFLRRAMAEAPHTVLDLAGEARAAEEPFAPEVIGRGDPVSRAYPGRGFA